MREIFKEISEQLQHIPQVKNKELLQELFQLPKLQELTHITQPTALFKNLLQNGVSDLK